MTTTSPTILTPTSESRFVEPGSLGAPQMSVRYKARRPVESVMNALTRSFLLCFLVVGTPLWLVHATDAAANNRLGELRVEEGADSTVIRVRGSGPLTYSAYRLRAPLRLFVDITDASLASGGQQVDVRNGVIADVRLSARETDLPNGVRMIITFDRDALYDVRVEGRELVVSIDGADRRPSTVATGSAGADALVAELEASQARIAALESALADARSRGASQEEAVLREQLRREGQDRSALEARVDELLRDRDTLASDAARLRAALEASQREAGAARSEADALRREAAAARAEAQGLESDVARERQRAQELEAEIRRLSAERGADSADVQRLREEQRDQSQRVARVEAERDAALRAAQAREQELQAALGASESDRARQAAVIEAQRAELEELRRQQSAAAASAPAASTPSEGPVRVSDVRFEQHGDVQRVIVEGTGPLQHVSSPWEEGQAQLVIEAGGMAERLQRRLDTTAFDGPVRSVASFMGEDGRPQVVVEFSGEVTEVLRQEGSRLVWEFRSVSQAAVASTSAPSHDALAPQRTSQQPRAGAAASAGRAPGTTTRRPRMPNKRITIDLRQADIHNVLRLFAEEGNINVVTDSGVAGVVTLRLRSVPLDEAFAIILRTQQLGWEQQGSIIRVAPLSVFEAEYEAELRRLAESREVEPLSVRIITVNYADVRQINTLAGRLLSSRGSSAVDTRTNSLIVTDVRSNLDAVETLIRQLDTQTPQILIEARIVETNDQFRRQLGIQWGGSFVADQALGNSTGLLFPSTIGIGGGATDGSSPTAGTSSSPNFAVNLPAPAGTGTGGAIGFTFGSLSGAFNLNLRLSAAESTGSAKIISAPRIMTLDNQTASISSGVSIPVSVVSAAGAQTTFFDASLSLNVTPRVTPDGNIFLRVSVSKNEPDFENTGARGDPSIVRREANTQLLVRDGDTTVIGGIFQRNTGFSSSYVPFFSRIPVIGPLFKNSSQTDVRNELLVFITPRVVNRELSIDRVGAGGDMRPPGDTRGGR